VIRASFTEETRRSFIEAAAAAADESAKASFAESIHSSEFEVLSMDESFLAEREADLEAIQS
jgi:hypothetical protein